MQFLKNVAMITIALTGGSIAAPVDPGNEIANLTAPTTNEKPVGQATWYVAGLGSCGVTNNGQTQDIVALPAHIMGELSNNNPLCGRKIQISYGGKSAPGTVQDKCMGCEGESIDLSEHLFKKFAPLSAGRINGVEWHWI